MNSPYEPKRPEEREIKDIRHPLSDPYDASGRPNPDKVLNATKKEK